MDTKRYQAPRGTQDVLPEEQPYWDYIRAAAVRLCDEFGYGVIQTPTFEDAGLFTRGVGEVTDIVEKEMYVFEDRGGQQLALRPEGTAPVCRAYLERGMSNLPQPVRLWYWTPIFRYDRPQAGRYRQHQQFGVEAIGDASASIDAEVIELLWRLYEELGLRDLTLNLNSIGDPVCRPAYLDLLRAYYSDKLDLICDDCKKRIERAPLRLLDCKNERCQPIIANAPTIEDHLCEPCAEHYADLLAYLGAIGLAYTKNPRLVRGLDYYTRAVFEFQPKEEGGQSTVGAGGRYDGLIEQIGGPHTPGTGFATGIERIILNLKRQNIDVGETWHPKLYVVYQTPEAKTQAYKLASDCRRAGVPAIGASGDRSLKAQLRHADALGAEYAAIIGGRELKDGTVALKRLSDGEQETVPLADVAKRLSVG